MDSVVLGRTGLRVSVAGLGCGGHSRLGRATGSTEDESVALVRRALELGVTYIDTARAYGTEGIVGRALAGRRDEVVLSTKASPEGAAGPLDAAGLRRLVERSLSELRTDHVDVFHLHGVSAAAYPHCRDVLVPELVALRDEGALRYLGISEAFGSDPGHEMLALALPDDCFDVVMVGFNLLNPSARDRVLPVTEAHRVGVEVMFAVRRALSHPDQLRLVAGQLVEDGYLGAGDLDVDDPLGFLVHEGGAGSVVEAAYRFVRHEPGCHVVLTGTGNPAHLEENIVSIGLPRLPESDLERLRGLFGHLDHLSGN
jgi:L-galactose dehydrogenase